jgi:predicted Fe-Mo cluster-binding NifX family protein
MSKLAMMVSRNHLDAPLAGNFGKAKWLLLCDSVADVEFRRNEELRGGGVASAIAAAGCRDVVAAHLGDKSFAHLSALGIRVWVGPRDTPVRDVIATWERGELRPWDAPGRLDDSGCSSTGDTHREHHHGEHHGLASSDVVASIGRRRP